MADHQHKSYTKDATSVQFKYAPVMPPLGMKARIRAPLAPSSTMRSPVWKLMSVLT